MEMKRGNCNVSTARGAGRWPAARLWQASGLPPRQTGLNRLLGRPYFRRVALTCFAPSQRRLNEPLEKRMSIRRLGLELRVTLHRQEPGMVLQFDDLHQLA